MVVLLNADTNGRSDPGSWRQRALIATGFAGAHGSCCAFSTSVGRSAAVTPSSAKPEGMPTVFDRSLITWMAAFEAVSSSVPLGVDAHGGGDAGEALDRVMPVELLDDRQKDRVAHAMRQVLHRARLIGHGGMDIDRAAEGSAAPSESPFWRDHFLLDEDHFR